jgi:DNA-binding response OmpR family regulator
MITSRTGNEHRQKAFDLGAVDFLTKPFSEESLIETIGRFSDIKAKVK